MAPNPPNVGSDAAAVVVVVAAMEEATPKEGKEGATLAVGGGPGKRTVPAAATGATPATGAEAGAPNVRLILAYTRLSPKWGRRRRNDARAYGL